MKYEYQTRPYKHQVAALKTLLRNGYGGALLMDPRTGKTKVAIDFASIKYLKGEIDRVFVACYPLIALDEWIEQIETHCPYEYDIFVWDRNQRKSGIPEPNRNRLLFVLVNYEAFQTPGKKLPSGRRSQSTGRIRNRNEVRRWAAKGSALGILDESHRISSSSARSATTVVSLHASFPYRVLLTGTVVTKVSKAHGIRMQWKFLNPSRFAEWPTDSEFKNNFGVWVEVPGVPVPIWKRGKNLDLLHGLMYEDAYSVRREDCFDLPPRDYETIKCELNGSARIYDDMANKMVVYIRQHAAEAPIPLVKLLRLAQITSGHIKTDKDKVIRVGHEKFDVIDVKLEKWLNNDESVVIAARFVPDIIGLTKIARTFKVPVHVIRGGMNRDVVRQELVAARKYKGPQIYVVQPQAASHAIDMGFCSRVVWYSMTPSFVQYKQCNDRTALSRKSTTISHIVARGTIDELLLESANTDGQFLNMIHKFPERLLRK